MGVRDLKENDLKLDVKKMNYYSVRPDAPTEPLTETIDIHLGTEDFDASAGMWFINS